MKQLNTPWIALLSTVFFCVLWNPQLTWAQSSPPPSNRTTGVGLLLGEPSGFSAQLMADTPHPIHAGLAWSFQQWFQIYGDYTWHFPRLISDLIQDHSPIDTYIGLGGGLLFFNGAGDDRAGLGGLIRFPLGLEYRLAQPPIGFFFELVPGFVFGSSVRGRLQGGIGARFFF